MTALTKQGRGEKEVPASSWGRQTDLNSVCYRDDQRGEKQKYGLFRPLLSNTGVIIKGVEWD